MDERYRAVADYVVGRFADYLGSRLMSAFVKGSITRGDALWGVSDIDLVLALDTPTPSDAALKQEIEMGALCYPAGDQLVIQRIWEDRLQEMTPGVRAFWLQSCRYDSESLFGGEPSSLLPPPPEGREFVNLIAPIIRVDGELEMDKPTLNRQESRHLAKRILHALSLPSLAEGQRDSLAHREIAEMAFPPQIQRWVPRVLSVYQTAPFLEHPGELKEAWRVAWEYVETALNRS